MASVVERGHEFEPPGEVMGGAGAVGEGAADWLVVSFDRDPKMDTRVHHGSLPSGVAERIDRKRELCEGGDRLGGVDVLAFSDLGDVELADDGAS